MLFCPRICDTQTESNSDNCMALNFLSPRPSIHTSCVAHLVVMVVVAVYV